MQAEDLILDESREGEVVKQVGKVFPDISISILAQTFIIKAVNLGNLARFVVSSEDCYALRIANFERDKKSHRFDGEVASINVVT